jgi:molybdopterin converting factor small subunit
MLRVKVKYLNVYCPLTGKKEEFVQLRDRLTVGELLQKLFQSYRTGFKDAIVDEKNVVRPHVWILVNQERVKDMNRKLTGADTVVFSRPPMGG